MSTPGPEKDGRPLLREAAIALCYLAFVAIGVATVLWPALEDGGPDGAADRSRADAGTP